MSIPMVQVRLPRWQRVLPSALMVAGAALGSLIPQLARASVFSIGEVDTNRFVIVSAPIGKGERAQLNIYEQLNDRRPCFAVGEGSPALVDPLLSTFDFTGICSRYLDANGYSLRVGGMDLGTVYRLSVRRLSDDTQLVAVPTKAGIGPEMVVARTRGPGNGFLRLELEPGWSLMRRQYGGRPLGHIYFYSIDWPGAGSSASRQPASPQQAPSPEQLEVTASPNQPGGSAEVVAPPSP